MKNAYIDLINQTFDFPTSPFSINENGELIYHKIRVMDLIESYESPLKVSHLPSINESISKCKKWFENSLKSNQYNGPYHYSYCTKSSHFSFVLEKVLEQNVHLETSSAFDLEIIENLYHKGKITLDHYILCNGYKTIGYIQRIIKLLEIGFKNIYIILDNIDELKRFLSATNLPLKLGIRIASEEEPKFEFYTSRLGIRYKDIIPFYNDCIKNNAQLELKMLHFFINTGIKDTAYYWNELHKCLRVYTNLKNESNSLDALNIGGGFPIKRSLYSNYNYEYMVDEIVKQIKNACKEENVQEPSIFTEFGSFTVGESGLMLFKIMAQKKQNDREKWNMIDGSFMTTLPDTWAINHRFIMLPLNRWNDEYERVLLGGLTCDSDDYYNSEQHINAIYLPKFDDEKPLYIGFFNTGAYQDSLSGYGGIKHCLIPSPKHLILDEVNGALKQTIFAEQQEHKSMLDILGYS